MQSYALDENNDIIVQAGALRLVTDAAETVQHIRSRILFYLEEWFLDRASGTPWFQEIFVKPVNLANVESIIKTRILGTEGVEVLTSFSMDFNPTSRKLTIDYSAETIYGSIDVSQVTLNG